MPNKRLAVFRYGLLASVSLASVACVPLAVASAVMAGVSAKPQETKVIKRTARVCDPKTDATCHPTPNTKVVVK